MSKYNLPSFLKPFSCEDLVRVGRDYDGGYVVNLKDIQSADGLISLGISHDWSFEKQFSPIKIIFEFRFPARSGPVPTATKDT